MTNEQYDALIASTSSKVQRSPEDVRTILDAIEAREVIDILIDIYGGGYKQKLTFQEHNERRGRLYRALLKIKMAS